MLGGILREHTLAKPTAWQPASTVIDVGAGLRPCPWYPTAQKIYIEPYRGYADVLRRQGLAVLNVTADEGLHGLRADAVVLLDVLEHMERLVGERVVQLAKLAAIKQVIIYTPFGFLPQDGDAWEMGGDDWQRHRSGWTPEDFPDWAIERRGTAFFATWTWDA